VNTCPTCHRPFGAQKRICFACRRPIGQKDKWHVEGCYILHDDCQNPTIRVLIRAAQPKQSTLDESPQQETHATEESDSPDRPQ